MNKSQEKPKVFVAMSGGVDSSVAAALLARSCDFNVVGCHMICWRDGEYCTSERDAEDARRVAEKLGIPFYVFDFTYEYRQRVFDYMVREYAAGRTPNPDVLCNSEIKFGIFLEKALALDADYIATGHYTRLRRNADTPAMLQAKDKNKDQSYFLWRLVQDQLRHVLFPIGDYTKSEVREMARKFCLPTAEKKDSQGLCFVGDVDFQEFLRKLLPRVHGDVITTSGKKVGVHDGAHFYTIGQRRGIGIGGRQAEPGEPRPEKAGGIPLYVAQKDISTNTLVVAEGPYDPKLYKKELIVTDVNWISGQAPTLPLECECRIRYRQPLQKARITNHESGFKVDFDEPQRAVTPGQSVVFYKNVELLGGGIIA